MKPEAVSTESAPAAIGPYSQGIRVGTLLFVSGQIPIDPKVGKITAAGVEEQAHQVLKNLGAILESQGLGFGSLVKTTIF